ncbi:ABC transporter permease [Schumannella soli]|nr:ABC transporter permease [Schumannella soli]
MSEKIPGEDQLPTPGQVLPLAPEPQSAQGVEPGQASGTKPADEVPPPPAANRVMREILSSNWLMTLLAIVLALVVASILIVVTDENVQKAAGYFFARPADTFQAIGRSIGGAYYSLFQGAVYNFARPGFVNGIKPLTETLAFAAPLIAAGLGVAVAFRVGLFNIGGRGQILIAAAVAGWISWSFPLPPFIHMLVAVVGALIGGAVWGGLVGFIKARTGAHEVILTIMLNYVALYLIQFLLKTPGALQAPGTSNPKTPPTDPSAVMPTLSDLLTLLNGGTQVGSFRLNVGFILVILATMFVAWLLNRSSTGFRFRAVGENPHAARVAGIDVKWVFVLAMIISGALVGLAGSIQVLGTNTSGFGDGIDAGIGFDAITVALLGRSRPWGVFFSGILFGALKAGGYSIQAGEGIPIDIVVVVQSVIVLFIAAPPLVRAVFRLPAPGSKPKARRPRLTAEVTR